MNFKDLPSNTPVITTKFVVDKTSPIVYISFDQDGDLQVFSDEGVDMANAKVISLENLLNLDSSISEIEDFKKGEKLYRQNIGSPWQKI